MKNFLPWILSGVLCLALIVQWIQLKQITASLKVSNQFIENQLNSFDAKLGRAETRIDSSGKLLQRLKDEIPSDIREDLRAAMAQVEAIAVARLSYDSSGEGRVARYVKPTLKDNPTAERPIDSAVVNDRDGSFPWQFSDWRLTAEFDGRDYFTYKLNQRFEVVLVEGSKGAGAPTYLRVWELDANGVRIEPSFDIQNFQVMRRKASDARFKTFNPKLDIALAATAFMPSGELRAAPEIGFSVMSYGQTLDDLKWRFVRVGLSHDGRSTGLSISPASYNLGKHLPLVSNLWLSPLYFWNGKQGLGLAISGAL